jgi:hypothetical protein
MKLQVLLILLALIGFGLVSNADYKDALRSERMYRDMVCGGDWPNYKKLDDLDCGGHYE